MTIVPKVDKMFWYSDAIKKTQPNSQGLILANKKYQLQNFLDKSKNFELINLSRKSRKILAGFFSAAN